MYILKASSKECKWEVFRPLGPHQNFQYQLCPEIDIEAEDFHRPDHFELLHSLNCHYDSIISSSGAPRIRQPTIEEIHIDCTHLVLDRMDNLQECRACGGCWPAFWARSRGQRSCTYPTDYLISPGVPLMSVSHSPTASAHSWPSLCPVSAWSLLGLGLRS